MARLTIEGKISPPEKDENYYSVEIPELDIYTQGENPQDCVDMSLDAIKTLFDDKSIAIEFLAFDNSDESIFYLTSNNPGPLYSRILQTLRTNNELSLRDVADKMGDSSHNNYAQYEQGKNIPSIDKFNEIVNAITGGESTLVLSIKQVKKVS